MKTNLLILTSLLITNLLFSQGENLSLQWRFSTNAGVDFTTGIPVAVANSPLVTGEGCATVSDLNGNLLFFTDGQEVYNRNNEIMPNGSDLMGDPSASQSSIIIPYPNNEALFYIFTIDAVENHLENGLRYSIVDMSLEGGLGDITTTKNILLETPVSEKITAILHTNNINVWLIAHKWDSNEFITYEISPSGINPTPIVSAIGSIHEGGYSSWSVVNGWTNAIGMMKANKQGNKIALAIHRMNKYELFDFDKNTGILSNFIESPTDFPDAYSVEFSPNGDYLYATQSISKKLNQFDLTQVNPFDNPYLISSGGYEHRGLQIGPNGKIYLSRLNNPYLSVINNPNNYGSNCNFENEEVYLEGKLCRSGLPSIFFYKSFQFFTGSEVDSTICEGDSIYLENAYQTIEDTYYDTVSNYLGWDSIINTHLNILPILPTPTITENTGILTSSSANNYQWYFNGSLISGATSQNYQALTSGTYQVATENTNGCMSFSEEYNFVYVRINQLKNNFSVYPNPINDKLFIKSDKDFKIELTNLNGQQIFIDNKKTKQKTVETLKIKSGVYILKITTNKSTIIRKIIKQ